MTTSDAAASSSLRCSFAADSRGDPLFGTAAFAKGFLLIEHPGAWGNSALTESQLDPKVAAIIASRAAEASYRVLLIKRPGRDLRLPRRSWAIVDSTPGAERMSWGQFASDEDLLDIRLGDRSHESRPGYAYLVCTHGRHDACCALRGRPIAAAFARERPEGIWECSHIGGDRFAPNVVALPHGFYYGRVDQAAVATIVAAHERSEVVIELLRGRATFRPAVQAAQHFARLDTGALAANDLEPIHVAPTSTGDVLVRLAHATGYVEVVVRPTVGHVAGLLTCRATNPMHPPTFSLEHINVFE